MPQSFEAFLKQREQISLDYINGRVAPLETIEASEDPATFMPPNGKLIKGADAVRAANAAAAKTFREGSRGRFEIVNSGSSGSFGFWTGLHHAEIMMQGREKAVQMILRTTEIFTLTEQGWTLVHRHADFLKEA